VSASKPFYGISTDLQIMIFEYMLKAHEPDDISLSASLLNDAYYVHKDRSSMARTGSRALLEVNYLSRKLALMKFSGTLNVLPVPFPGVYQDPTPVLSIFRFSPDTDVIYMDPFYTMAIRIFPGISLALSSEQDIDSDGLREFLYALRRWEWDIRLQETHDVPFEEIPVVRAHLWAHREQMWRLSSIQNLVITYEDLVILTSMHTRLSYAQRALRVGFIVNWLLSNKSFKKLTIEKPYWMAGSREARRHMKQGDAWVLDFNREHERRFQERAKADARKLRVRLTPRDLEVVQAMSLIRCMMFILGGNAVNR
jgi:hypothetical protein